MRGLIDMMGYGFGIMSLFGMIVPLLLIALIIYAIVKFAQGSHGNYSTRNEGNDALDILSQRYAKGEISDEEYEHKKKMLRN